MKGLLKTLSPFAPDQSGAAGVFYDMDCITVICDAGGCTGNTCGFDEPRWFKNKRPVFSAGLRDMDAILGRDDLLVKKLSLACQNNSAEFAVIIGTPVPAVIATDFNAIKRMAEKKCGLPVLTIECTGTRLFDAGEEDAFFELFKQFAGTGTGNSVKSVGIIGATPLETSDLDFGSKISNYYKNEYENVFCYGMGSGLDSVKNSHLVSKNIVVSPSGLKCARYMKDKFGIPFETVYPVLPVNITEFIESGSATGRHVCVIHQQVIANEIRNRLKPLTENVDVASFFKLDRDLSQERDVLLETEDGFREFVTTRNFDIIIGDELLRRAVHDFQGQWINAPHFAVSGNLI